MLTTYLLIFITISFSRAFLFNPSVNDSSYGYKCPQDHSLTMQAINHSTSVSRPRKHDQNCHGCNFQIYITELREFTSAAIHHACETANSHFINAFYAFVLPTDFASSVLYIAAKAAA